MAIATCSVHIISRGKGRSAVAAAAYRAGQTLQSDYDGLCYSYSRKRGVVHESILSPDLAPEWAQDRQQLWNRVEHTERRKDARLAREVMVALPQELSSDQNIALSREYALTFVRQGMIADVAVHDTGDGNPHAHILLTTRPLDGDGFSKKKNRDWDSVDRLIEWRNEYESITNHYLERYGHEQRIDVRSYEEQGIDQIPTIHLGHYAYRMEQSGKETERGNINRDIQKANREIEEINREIVFLKEELEQEREYVKPVDDDKIKHYSKVREELRRTAEALGHRLTGRGEQSLAGQQRNVEAALQRLRQASVETDEPFHHPPAVEPERQRPFRFGEPSGESMDTPRPQKEPSGASVDPPRSPGGQRPPERDEPSGRPGSPPRPLAPDDQASSRAKPLSGKGFGAHSFHEPAVGNPPRPVQQPDSQDVLSHHSRTSPEGMGRKLSHQDLLQRLKKERDEEQAGRERDEDPERQK